MGNARTDRVFGSSAQIVRDETKPFASADSLRLRPLHAAQHKHCETLGAATKGLLNHLRVSAKPQAGHRQRAYAAPSSAGFVAARPGALRDLTRRICLNAASKASAVSYV